MTHPLLKLDRPQRARLFRWTLALTLLNMVVLQYYGQHLVNDVAPAGIVSYEFVTSPEHAQAVLDSWSEVRYQAFMVLLFDISYPILYATNIALACLWTATVARERNWPLAFIGTPLAWGLWSAALFDYAENTASVIMLLQETVTNPWPAMSYFCAAIKFAFVIAGLLYALYGLAPRFLGKIANPS